MRKKVINRNRLPSSLKRAIRNGNQLGIANDKLVEPVPNFIQAPCEKIIQGDNNTFITLGRDRPNDLLSGYGGKGHTGAGAIDIVVGRKSKDPKSTNNDGLSEKAVYTHNDYIEDASRILISQKTDIDKNFKLSEIEQENCDAKAAIALKSDNIRLIGRESLRLITGTDLENSRGGKQISIPGIYLIAGNNPDELQAIPLGANLQELLIKILGHIDNISSIVDTFMTYQHEFNSVLQNHNHPDPVGMFLGQMSENNPLAVNGGRDMPSPEVVSAGTKVNMQVATVCKGDLIKHKTNLVNTKLRYLKPYGNKYINSRHHKVN